MDEKLLKKLLEIKNVEDEAGANLVLAEILAPGGDFLNQLAHEQLDLEMIRQKIAPRLFAKVTEEADGPIHLGTAIEDGGRALGLVPSDPTRLILVVGTPGSGKTTCVRGIHIQLINRSQGTIPESATFSFDAKLDSVNHYKSYPDVTVIHWKRLCFNPLQVPKGVDPKDWLNYFVDVFCGVFFIGEFGYQILLETVNYLYESSEVYRGKPAFPTLRHLYGLIWKNSKRAFRSREQEAIGSLLNRIKGLLTTFGNGVDYHEGMCVPELTSRHIVLVTHGLGLQHQAFLVSLIIAWTYLHHQANNLRGDKLRVTFIVDEAEPILGRDLRQRLGNLPILFQLIPRLREFGIGLIVSNQNPRTLDDRSVLSFAQTKIVKNLVDNQDISFIGKSLGLNADQMNYCRGMKPEEAIVFLSRRQPDAALVQVPDIPLDKEVDWNDVERVMEPRIRQLFQLIPASTPPKNATPVPPSPSSPPPSAPASPKSSTPNPNSPPRTPPPGAKKANQPTKDDIKAVVMDTYNRPFIPKSERLSALFGDSTSKQQKVAKACLDEGYVMECDVHAGGRSGVLKLWRITDKGYAFIGLPKRPLPGKGDLTHQYLQFKVAEKVKKWGLKPRIEDFRRGKNVDVGVQLPKVLLAIEIATTAGNEMTNVLKDIDAGFHQVLILAVTETVRKSIERTLNRQVSPSYLNRVSVLNVSAFLDASTPPW